MDVWIEIPVDHMGVETRSHQVIDFTASDALSAKPSLAHDIDVGIQIIRGHKWAVVQNRVSGTFLRVREPVWKYVAQLQGQITLQDWLARHSKQIEADELLSTLVTLSRDGIVVICDQQVTEITDRAGKKIISNAMQLKAWSNPMMIRIPLMDPNHLMGRLSVSCKALTLNYVILLSVVVLLLAISLGVSNGGELIAHWQQSLRSMSYWWMYLVLYPVLKLAHEIAHAVVLRRLGGEVHEAGISLLVFMPIPYVNATDSWRISSRYHRMLVTAAGMWAEGLIAAIGLIGFCLLQPGLLRDMLFGVFALGSVSTIIFNANPLLRFDGYYLLEDYLQIPGLARRSQLYIRCLYKRYVLRVEVLHTPVAAEGEQKWFVVYGVLSSVYRCFICLVIAVFLVNTLHEVGMLLALFVLATCFLRPILVWVQYILTSTELDNRRVKAILSNGLLASLFVIFVFAIPMPSSTRAEGIVWVPEQAELFAAEEGNIVQWMAEEGEWLEKGQSVLRLESPQLIFEQKAINAEVRIKELEHDTLKLSRPNQAKKVLSELNSLKNRQNHLDERVSALEIKTNTAGRLAKNEGAFGSGQHLTKGQLLGYIVDPQSLIVRAVVDQEQLGRVKAGIQDISVRVAHSVTNRVSARLSQLTPAGDNDLPSLALADIGYGGISMDIDQALGIRTSEQVFHLELELLEDTHSSGIGGLAFISMQHTRETLAIRWWRSSRQLMLKHLPV